MMMMVVVVEGLKKEVVRHVVEEEEKKRVRGGCGVHGNHVGWRERERTKNTQREKRNKKIFKK